jgi:hypothetical protein
VEIWVGIATQNAAFRNIPLSAPLTTPMSFPHDYSRPNVFNMEEGSSPQRVHTPLLFSQPPPLTASSRNSSNLATPFKN